MNNTLTLYHGSTQVITAPALAKGKPNNDYGRGFYCTQSLELAKEWACSTEMDGFNYEATQSLDPDLGLYNGRQYAPLDKRLFGLFADSCPDRWG